MPQLFAYDADDGNDVSIGAAAKARPVAGTSPGEKLYHALINGPAAGDVDVFDRHVVASILAIAYEEAMATSSTNTACAGLEAADLAQLGRVCFPHAAHLLPPEIDAPLPRAADEACVQDLLWQCATARSPLERWLAGMVARRAQRPNHLWQDLGLRNRAELGRLMRDHFRVLAARNTGDMKWKKFLYRMVCRDAAYTICTAPSCGECTDFENCFGDESGESFLARTRVDL